MPAHANAHLLSEILKDGWGFDGLVVSDCRGDLELIEHGVAGDESTARA